MEIKDYRALIRYGDMKKLMELTGYSRYIIETRLASGDFEMTELLKTFYAKKLEILKNQVWENQH